MIGRAQPELTPSKRQKTGPELELLGEWHHHGIKIWSTLLTLCDGNPPVTSGFPLQKDNNVERFSISCCRDHFVHTPSKWEMMLHISFAGRIHKMIPARWHHSMSVIQSFDFFVVIGLNKLLNTLSSCWWFEIAWQSFAMTLMVMHISFKGLRHYWIRWWLGINHVNHADLSQGMMYLQINFTWPTINILDFQNSSQRH